MVSREDLNCHFIDRFVLRNNLLRNCCFDNCKFVVISLNGFFENFFTSFFHIFTRFYDYTFNIFYIIQLDVSLCILQYLIHNNRNFNNNTKWNLRLTIKHSQVNLKSNNCIDENEVKLLYFSFIIRKQLTKIF